MDGTIERHDPGAPVRALLAAHLAFTHGETPLEHAFALDAEGLRDPAIELFGYRRDGELLAIGALKRLDGEHAELKSMHTAAAARRTGIGRAMVDHLLATARTRSFRRVSLETGTTEAFAPARSLYRKAGFEPCGPFGGYAATPDNYFMTIRLDP